LNLESLGVLCAGQALGFIGWGTQGVVVVGEADRGRRQNPIDSDNVGW